MLHIMHEDHDAKVCQSSAVMWHSSSRQQQLCFGSWLGKLKVLKDIMLLIFDEAQQILDYSVKSPRVVLEPALLVEKQINAAAKLTT